MWKREQEFVISPVRPPHASHVSRRPHAREDGCKRLESNPEYAQSCEATHPVHARVQSKHFHTVDLRGNCTSQIGWYITVRGVLILVPQLAHTYRRSCEHREGGRSLLLGCRIWPDLFPLSRSGVRTWVCANAVKREGEGGRRRASGGSDQQRQ